MFWGYIWFGVETSRLNFQISGSEMAGKIIRNGYYVVLVVLVCTTEVSGIYVLPFQGGNPACCPNKITFDPRMSVRDSCWASNMQDVDVESNKMR